MWKRVLLLFVLTAITVSCGNKPSNDSAVNPGTQEEGSLLSDLWEVTANTIDKFYGRAELTKERARNMNHYTDSCHPDFQEMHSFADMQNYFILKHLEDRPAQIDFLSSYYQVPKNINDIYPTSLMSHELCPVTEESLTASLSAGKVPDSETIQMLNEFTKINNQLRANLRVKDTYQNKFKYSQHWSKLTGCLAYAESLTTADSAESKEIAARNAPAGYTRPQGVGFYEDPQQPPVSRLNIGMYQFTPNMAGNIQACARQWNSMYPRCKIDLQASDTQSFKILGSELQAFNIFCGINKIQQMFSVQVNSTEAKRTHISNSKNSKLKSSKDRCVSINFHSTYAYNHFGPFQNSTGKNLKALMACYFR